MPSPEFDKLLKKLFSLPRGAGGDIAAQRQALEKAAGYFTLVSDVGVERIDAGGVSAEWLTPEGASERGVLLYLHGGGYSIGSINSHRHMVANIARAAKTRALLIEYRLCPEHPFPAGLDDAVAAYRWLLEGGARPENIIIGGDSAGGGLTFATLLKLREDGSDLPAGAVALSPWTDLTGSGDSIETRAERDPLLKRDGTGSTEEWYANGAELTEPLISPLFADLEGLPPLFIQVGDAEILLDDSTRFAQSAREQGVDVELEVWDDMFHVWHYYADWIPEGRKAIEKIAAFMNSRLAR